MGKPLQPAYVDVPLGRMDQHTTKTGGPIGRIKRLVNAVVKKITPGDSQSPPALRVEKRDGFSTLPSTVRDPATGAVSSKTVSTPTLFGTYGLQLVAVFLAAPFVLSESAGCWESPTYNAPTQVLRSSSINVPNDGVVNSVDSTRIGTKTMTAWTTAPGAVHYWYQLVDDDGTVIRTPNITFTAGTGKGLKLVNDGTQFWLVVGDGTTGNISAQAYDINGNLLGLTTLASVPGTFDVTQNTNAANSIVVVVSDGASGFKIVTSTWTGASFSNVTTTISAGFAAQKRFSILPNHTGDHRYYITTIDGAGPFTTYLIGVLDSSMTVSLGPYTVKAGDVNAPVEATGFAAGAFASVVALSYLDTTPTPQLNFTTVYTITAGGVSTLARTQKSLTLASRAFQMQTGGDYYAVGYYHSNPAGATGIAQSTYFLMDLGTNYQVAGRFEYGTAYQDWLVASGSAYFMAVSSANVDPSGGVHIALAYRASSTIAVTTIGDTFQQVKTLVDVVGIKDYQFGPDSGQSVEHSAALFMPGPEAVNYTGATFAEDGIGLIPEVLSVVNGGAGSLSGTFEYVVVDEWTDNNGQRVRSASGLPNSITGNAFQVTITGLHNHVTRKQNLIHSVYRTTHDLAGVQSTIHSKVTGSLQGGTYLGSVIVNDDTANTWTFTDNMIDSVAANNEELYTDKGLLDHFPAPAFSVGLATFDRIIVWGYDKALWISGPKTDGDSFWFHPDLRMTLPTQDEVTAIKLLDGNIVVMTDGNSNFAIPNGPWPDATGEGTFPTPVILPFSNGCTGFAETISDGIIYSSTQGGIWLITRSFENKYIGAPVEDELPLGTTITAVATDDRQRTVFSTSAGTMLVYDQVTGVWGVWQGVVQAAMLTEHKGRIAYADGISLVWRQTLGQYFDNEAGFHAQIPTTVTLAFLHLGGIRRFVRLWQTQMYGEWLGDHDMTVTAAVDDQVATVATGSFTPVVSGQYVYELAATEQTELCSSISYTFTDSFPRGASQGYALEGLSLFIGLGDRPNMLQATQQIKSA